MWYLTFCKGRQSFALLLIWQYNLWFIGSFYFNFKMWCNVNFSRSSLFTIQTQFDFDRLTNWLFLHIYVGERHQWCNYWLTLSVKCLPRELEATEHCYLSKPATYLLLLPLLIEQTMTKFMLGIVRLNYLCQSA